MLSLVTKSLLGLAGAAFVASIAYGIATGDDAGTTMLAVVAVGAFALAVVSLAAGPDLPPVASAEGPDPQNAPAGGRPMFPSFWPFAAGLAVSFLAIGSAMSAAVVVPAIILAVVVLLGWLFQAWTEHPIFTARFGARLSDRLLVPFGMPLFVFSLVAVTALSLSRVLLAVNENGSRAVAIVVAVAIMASGFFIVSQERMARAALGLLSVFAFVTVVSAGIVGFSHGERQFVKRTGGAPVASPQSIAAHDVLAFTPSSLTFPAGHVVPLRFDNETPLTPHNVGIFDHQGGNELFRGQVVTGVNVITYQVPPLSAGNYYFECDVHPNMHGTLTVTPAGTASAPSGAVAAGTAPTTTTPASTATSLQVTAGFATTPTIAKSGG